MNERENLPVGRRIFRSLICADKQRPVKPRWQVPDGHPTPTVRRKLVAHLLSSPALLVTPSAQDVAGAMHPTIARTISRVIDQPFRR